MTCNAQTISTRRAVFAELGSYNDRNDGFERSNFSRSKANFSRNRKIGKPERVKAPWKMHGAA